MCEVTSANFSHLFPLILQQIDKSCFLSLDTEFSAIDSNSSRRNLQQFYKQSSNFIQQITVFQFGLAVFSKTSNQHRYHVDIYNFYLKPTSVNPIDVQFIIQSSSIKFLSEYKFDFNKCFYSGISFLNKAQEKRLYATNEQMTSLSVNERRCLNTLFEQINQWLINADLGDRIEYNLSKNYQDVLNDYLIQREIRRCFKTIWAKIQLTDSNKILVIEHVTRDVYEQRLKDNHDDVLSFIQSLTGFTKLIRYIQDNYRKPIIGHNCFLDWLIIYDKFIDTLPPKFEDFQMLINKNFNCSIFDTKYLALQMRDYLFTRRHRQNNSNYVENFTTSTSLESLYELLTSKYYENLIFLKPIIEMNADDRYQNEVRTHEAGYDAYMSGVIFLKLIYLYKQKRVDKIDFNEHQCVFDICLNEMNSYKNRFYTSFLPYISLNHYDKNVSCEQKLQQCLVVEHHNHEQLDLSDLISRFDTYCAMEYEVSRNGKRIYLLFQSEFCERRILKDYFNHPVYRVEKFQWFQHSSLIKYSFSISVLLTGVCLIALVKWRM
ncbi:unnamed protein product [Adineta ricciae]|uniref:Uncharacterized protein n=1 Tax=Adineta ricciae TaxID=249248 RepID=A0A814CRX7_ADIRI|nr:unnamed protein product [Adineta ricciae]CAF1386963.1 unnamed protein product [Adineta ricciae]